MSFKRTIQEWNNAIYVLISNAAKFSEMEDEILPIIKYSYDNLKGKQVQPCLLYCALFPEDERISKSDLIEYWICEGIIDDNEGMEKAENQGYEIIGSLIRSSLLMEEDRLKVYMHDVVREMALWIASDFGEQKDNFVVHAGAGLCKVPKLKNWNAVKRLSLMANKIDHISGSPEFLQLTTLFLQRNKTTLSNISSEFLDSMPRLGVLDLSHNHALSHIPNRIELLVSLKYLNLSDTSIGYLPIGLQRLRNLIHLDLECTRKLSSINGVSELLSLKVLKLLDSRVAFTTKAKEELKDLEHLEILTICIDSDSGLDDLLSSHKLMDCTQLLNVKGCQLESSDIRSLHSMEKVRELTLHECTISEKKMDIVSITRETISPPRNPKNAIVLSLSKLHLLSCKWSKEMTWLMFAPNLTELIVNSTEKVEEIINKEKASEAEESGLVPFQKLEYLKLENLRDLKNIYWRPLPFPCLMQLKVYNCPNLKKLPVNSKSGSSGEKGLIVDVKNSYSEVAIEWEDEATKARFYKPPHKF